MDISQLALQLESDDEQTRCEAAESLCQMGANAQAAAVPLVRAAADDAEEVREWVVSSLEELGPPAVEDVAALAQLVDDQSLDTGYWAATLLGRLEGAAADAVTDLSLAVQTSPHMAVKQRAVWALGRIGPAAISAETSLRAAAKSTDPRLARLATTALESLRS